MGADAWARAPAARWPLPRESEGGGLRPRRDRRGALRCGSALRVGAEVLRAAAALGVAAQQAKGRARGAADAIALLSPQLEGCAALAPRDVSGHRRHEEVFARIDAEL